MLVKAKDDVIAETITDSNEYSVYQQSTYVEKKSWTFTVQWLVEFSCNLRSSVSWYYSYVRVDINGDSQEDRTSSTSNKKVKFTFIQKKSNYSIKLKWSWGNFYSYLSDIKMVVYQYIMRKPQIPLIVSSIKWLWNRIEWIFYWMDEEWGLIWWIMINESESATTGNITLGNAEWYIRVRFNWKYIKIPYYDD